MGAAKALLLLFVITVIVQVAASHWIGGYGYPPLIYPRYGYGGYGGYGGFGGVRAVGGFGGVGAVGGFGVVRAVGGYGGFGYGGYYRPRPFWF
ncbi:unnamed protein product [Euphydryas editha]|uniref:Uncharacterized protein n=1 Tax=Euphydryas editha TaxID=104508 RepID=A0AAU9TEP0_EUPED|nr:unnamed protein product [Euphydryas editha]